MRNKRGFTLVEMMVVVAIIGILLGIATTAIASSIRQARARKAEACCLLLQQGLATYYAQYGKWPGSIGEKISSGLNSRSNSEGVGGQSNANIYVLNADEIDDMVRVMILEAKKGNPMMDISGLFVSRFRGESSDRHFGMDFADAVHGTKRSPKKMKVAEMHFGYPDTNTGWFRRFNVVYSIPTDEMKVTRQ